jgi:hypothetical protein
MLCVTTAERFVDLSLIILICNDVLSDTALAASDDRSESGLLFSSR